MNKGFKQQTLYPSAVFAIQPELDEQYVLSSLSFVQSLLDQEGRIGTIDIKLKEGLVIVSGDENLILEEPELKILFDDAGLTYRTIKKLDSKK